MMDTIENVVDRLQAGEMIVVVDDESRENEGDLVNGRRKGHFRRH